MKKFLCLTGLVLAGIVVGTGLPSVAQAEVPANEVTGFVVAPMSGQIARTSVGQKPAAGVSNDYTPAGGQKRAVTTTAYFGARTANKVRLTSFLLCYSGPKASAVWISPYTLQVNGSVSWESNGSKQLYTGQCKSWNVNRDYTKQSNNELVRIVNRVSDSAGKYPLIAGFNR